jgi:predicted enzyme related to lactoylglutathione lyase
MNLTGICLNTPNVPALAEFYSRLLNLPAEGDENHAEMHTAGAGIAIFSTRGMEAMAPGSMQGACSGSVTLMIEVEDVDVEYERVKNLGVAFIMLPTTHPWGARSFWIKDPDGNIVDFYTALPGRQ